MAFHSLDSLETGLVPITHSAARNEVIDRLGQPVRKQVSRLPEGPFLGPQEGLESVLGPDSLYEEWLYGEGGYNYYVWFGTTTGQERNEWVVVAVAKYPTGAVF